MKNNIETYFDLNNIIIDNHHGSRRFHGTNTAVTEIKNELNVQYENNKLTVTILTDLLAAFDIVDSNKLLEKLNFYGIEGVELRLMSSFLKGRKQYVEIDSFRSDILDSPECSVV